jgi:sulfite reductase alpha subunit-like flavoprotein
LQKSLAPDLFYGVRFAIFSLGDRAYGPQKFCAAGRKLTVRLRQLGATLLVDPGYGDDGTSNGGVFCDLDHWLEATLFPQLGAYAAVTESTSTTTTAAAMTMTIETIVAPPYRVTVSSNSSSSFSNSNDDDDEEEWQQDEYAESYGEFFQKLCPLTAYHYYDCHNGSRMHPQNMHESSNSPAAGAVCIPLLGRVVENRRLTAADWEQNTRHICLEIAAPTKQQGVESERQSSSSSSPLLPSSVRRELSSWSLESLPYRAGDVASILPSNASQEVQAFLNVLPVALREIADCDLIVQFDPSCSDDANRFAGVGYDHWPTKCTLRGWLMHCADIHALPEREDLRALALYCSNDSPHGRDQREKLVSLSETKSSALYVDYILREKRSWVDVLHDFNSLRDNGSLLTIESLLGLLSPIRPRDFSIASSPTKDWVARQTATSSAKRGEFGVELCVAVVEGSTRLGRSFHGLCSYYLGQLPVSSEDKKSVVRLWIRAGSFHALPLDCTIDPHTGNGRLQDPILCIGAGTGVAPLRALIQEREAVLGLNAALSSSYQMEEDLEFDNALVFGCRMKDVDFYYEEEFRVLANHARMTLLVAFSREQSHKIYVQQVIGSADFGSKKLACHILQKNGAIYVAGGPNMARAVKETIVELLGIEMNGDKKEAQQLLSKLQRRGRYSVEAWN